MMEDHEDTAGGSKRPVTIPPNRHARLAATTASPGSGSPHSPMTLPAQYAHGSRSYPSAEQHSSGSDSDSEEDSGLEEDEQPSASTLEAAVAAKQSIERFYQNFFRSLNDREARCDLKRCPYEHLEGTKRLLTAPFPTIPLLPSFSLSSSFIACIRELGF